MRKKFERLRDFVLRDLWREIPTPSRIKAFALQSVRVAVFAVRDFFTNRCLMRATSLAYVTLLSLVPLLAFAFSVLKGLGVGDQIKPWIIKRVAAGQEQVVGEIIAKVEGTNVRALGTIGLLFLLWTTIKLLSSIESSFNHIWNVTRSRTFFRKVADYVSVLIISPMLLFTAMSLTAAFQSNAFVARVRDIAILGSATELVLGLAPYIGTWVAFAALYIFMPNTRVRLVPSMVAGVVAGTIWNLAFWAYAHFQIGVAQYSAIYSTFAAIPIFMIWLYVSWTIVLFGAEVSFAAQNVGRYWEEQRAAGASFASVEEIGLRAMTALSTAFYRDGGPLSIEQISGQIHAPGRLVADALRPLVEAGLCVEVVAADGSAYQPGRALEKIAPADVLDALRKHGEAIELGTEGPDAALVAGILQADGQPAEGGEAGASLTFRDIAERLAEETEAPAASSKENDE